MLKWTIRAALSSVVIALLLAIVPVKAVGAALSQTRPWVWLLSLGIFMAGHYINALKFRLLVGDAHTPRALYVRAQFAGQASNLALPGLAGGDLVRAAYVAPSVGTARVALASLADRLVDTATLVVLIAMALPLAGVPIALEGVLEEAGWWIGGAAVAGTAALGLVAWLRPHPRLAAMIDRLWDGLRARRGAVAAAVLLSLGVQSAFVMTNVWLAREVGVGTSIAAWFVAWPLSKLVAVLPISLGGIGVREAVLVTLLAPYGAPGEAVLASGILWQAVLIVSGLVGFAVTHNWRPTPPAPAGASQGAR
jgi:uncharacterized membrane protein YbhN (UPF0104 family)